MKLQIQIMRSYNNWDISNELTKMLSLFHQFGFFGVRNAYISYFPTQK